MNIFLLIKESVGKMLRHIKKFLNRHIIKDINFKTAVRFLKQNDGVLIDVRSKQEYEEEHLAGAININLYDLEKEIKQMIKAKNKTIVVCCTSGGRSKQAQIILEKLGYENVYNLKDGINGI